MKSIIRLDILLVQIRDSARDLIVSLREYRGQVSSSQIQEDSSSALGKEDAQEKEVQR